MGGLEVPPQQADQQMAADLSNQKKGQTGLGGSLRQLMHDALPPAAAAIALTSLGIHENEEGSTSHLIIDNGNKQLNQVNGDNAQEEETSKERQKIMDLQKAVSQIRIMQKKIGTSKNAANAVEGPRNTLSNVFGA